MAKPENSKAVLEHSKSVTLVGMSWETNRETLRAAVRQKLGENAATGAISLGEDAVARMLLNRDTAVAEDHVLTLERADDGGLLAGRDAAFVTAFGATSSAREGVTSLKGRATVEAAGVVGDTPNDPAALARFATVFVAGLRALPAGPSRFPGVPFDPAAFAEVVAPTIEPLEKAVAALAADVRENEAALVKRDRALAASIETFRLTATLLSALLELAGESELAARVRPSGRNPGTVADEPTPEPVAA